MKKHLIVNKFKICSLVFTGLLFSLAITNNAFAKKKHESKRSVESKASAEKKTYEVSVASPANYKFEDSIEVGGILKPTDVSYTFPYGDGVIKKVHVSSGQKVKKGDLLFTVEPQNNLSGFSKQKVIANKNGLVLQINAFDGDIVSKTKPIALIANPKLAAIKFSFSHEDKESFARLSSIKALSPRDEMGELSITLKNYNRLSDDTTQAFQGYLDVKCEITCEPLLGSYVRVALIKNAVDMLSLDKRGVSLRDNSVRIVQKNGTVKVVPIDIVKVLKSTVILKSDLKTSDKVVVSSNMKGKGLLKNDDHVVIEKKNYADQKSNATKKTQKSIK
jgi:membrane fusion protein, multidrug efflux system